MLRARRTRLVLDWTWEKVDVSSKTGLVNERAVLSARTESYKKVIESDEQAQDRAKGSMQMIADEMRPTVSGRRVITTAISMDRPELPPKVGASFRMACGNHHKSIGERALRILQTCTVGDYGL